MFTRAADGRTKLSRGQVVELAGHRFEARAYAHAGVKLQTLDYQPIPQLVREQLGKGAKVRGSDGELYRVVECDHSTIVIDFADLYDDSREREDAERAGRA